MKAFADDIVFQEGAPGGVGGNAKVRIGDDHDLSQRSAGVGSSAGGTPLYVPM